jgi:hypothetical protein
MVLSRARTLVSCGCLSTCSGLEQDGLLLPGFQCLSSPCGHSNDTATENEQVYCFFSRPEYRQRHKRRAYLNWETPCHRRPGNGDTDATIVMRKEMYRKRISTGEEVNVRCCYSELYVSNFIGVTAEALTVSVYALVYGSVLTETAPKIYINSLSSRRI